MLHRDTPTWLQTSSGFSIVLGSVDELWNEGFVGERDLGQVLNEPLGLYGVQVVGHVVDLDDGLEVFQELGVLVLEAPDGLQSLSEAKSLGWELRYFKSFVAHAVGEFQDPDLADLVDVADFFGGHGAV